MIQIGNLGKFFQDIRFMNYFKIKNENAFVLIKTLHEY